MSRHCDNPGGRGEFPDFIDDTPGVDPVQHYLAEDHVEVFFPDKGRNLVGFVKAGDEDVRPFLGQGLAHAVANFPAVIHDQNRPDGLGTIKFRVDLEIEREGLKAAERNHLFIASC